MSLGVVGTMYRCLPVFHQQSSGSRFVPYPVKSVKSSGHQYSEMWAMMSVGSIFHPERLLRPRFGRIVKAPDLMHSKLKLAFRCLISDRRSGTFFVRIICNYYLFLLF